MYYVTVPQGPMYHQLTLEEFILGKTNSYIINGNVSNTRTFECKEIGYEIRSTVNVDVLIKKLSEFNKKYKKLFECDRKSLYYEFYIPKRTGGLRKIDAPNDDLMVALRELKLILENDFKSLYHTSAFAYIKDRSTVKAIDRHVNNKSEWYAKLDLSNFFGSTTISFVISMMEKIFPFCLVCENKNGKEELIRAIDLAFLDGGLPQGTPISPMITNLIMIPIDFKLCNILRNFNGNRYIYTRYADDFQISSRYKFDVKDITKLVDGTLKEFGAPFSIKPEKTRYGSASGRNWNLGLMVTKDKDGNIKKTIGHKKEHQFSGMLNSFVMDTKAGKYWSINDIQVLDGYMNYYLMIEKKEITNLIDHIGNKNGVNIRKMIKEQLRNNG